jgi:hypothetical protein
LSDNSIAVNNNNNNKIRQEMHKNSGRENCAVNKSILFVAPNQAGIVML